MNIEAILDESMWANKYRPKKIEDIILPQQTKDLLKSGIESGEPTNFLFKGPPGIGKTTAAKAIAEELNAEKLVLNGSGDGRGINTVRNIIPSFCSTTDLEGRRKIVLIDEADNMTSDAFDALRHIIEKYSKGTTFIFTCNYVSQIPQPVRDRFVEIDFSVTPEEKKQLMLESAKRTIAIVNQEMPDYELGAEEKTVLKGIIQQNFPNVRKILTKTQQLAQAKQLNSAALGTIGDDTFEDLIQMIKDGKWKQMRNWVEHNTSIQPEDIVEYFWSNMEKDFGVEKCPMAIVVIDEYQKDVDRVPNKSVATVAMLTRLIKVVN